MTPKQRIDHASDPAVVAETWIHEWHADIAEDRLALEGVRPELLAYLQGIGERA